jgi:hypothetical protein
MRAWLMLPLLAGLAAPGVAQAAQDGVDKATFQAAARTRLLQGDTGKDGRLSKAEWIASAQARGAKRDPGRVFDKLDTNHDGFLATAEIDALSARRFTKIDANADSMVTASERQAAREGTGD